MTPQYIDLNNRIQAFDFNTANTKVTFAQRLMREHDWTKDFTDHVIREYRKFLLLTIVAGHRVVPSDQVDQAWHLNMLNSRSYWQDLCPNVLGKDLHHQPNPGGKSENINHFEDYRQTLLSYEKIFGQPAPDDIWPSAEIRFGRDLSFVRVNYHDYWLFKKPVINWRRFLGIGLTATLPLLMVGCTEISDKALSEFERILPISAFLTCLLLMFESTVVFGFLLLLGLFLHWFVNAPSLNSGILLCIGLLLMDGKSKSNTQDFDDDLIDTDDNDSSNDSSGCSSDSGGCGGGCGGD